MSKSVVGRVVCPVCGQQTNMRTAHIFGLHGAGKYSNYKCPAVGLSLKVAEIFAKSDAWPGLGAYNLAMVAGQWNHQYPLKETPRTHAATKEKPARAQGVCTVCGEVRNLLKSGLLAAHYPPHVGLCPGSMQPPMKPKK